MNDRPSPTHNLEMLDETSKTWLTHDESYQPIVGDRQVTLYAPRAYACQSTPEYQSLLGVSITAKHEASRRGMVMREIIECQEKLRRAAHEESLVTKDEEDRSTLNAAANALWPFATRLKSRRDDHLDQQREADEAIERMRAAERAAHPIDGMTNIEMSDLLQRGKDKQRAAIERDGCCGGPPMEDGFCFGIGMCPRIREAESAVKFCNSVVEYAAQVKEESALAAVAARLSGNPIVENQNQ